MVQTMARAMSVILWASVALAQPRFEVAAIRMTTAKELEAIRQSGRSSLFPEQGISFTGDRVTVIGLNVATLIRAAYNLRAYQFSGGTGWIASDSYDISAKAEGPGPLNFEQIRQMLQTFLADRFQLQFHREIKDGSAYALTIAKGGPKLTASLVPNYSTHVTSGPGEIAMVLSRATMDQLCSRLSTFTGRTVVDKTNLPGVFDMKLAFAPEGLEPSAGPREIPSIFTALQEQLGLKLESTTAPIDMFFVDQVARPSSN